MKVTQNNHRRPSNVVSIESRNRNAIIAQHKENETKKSEDHAPSQPPLRRLKPVLQIAPSKTPFRNDVAFENGEWMDDDVGWVCAVKIECNGGYQVSSVLTKKVVSRTLPECGGGQPQLGDNVSLGPEARVAARLLCC